MPSPEEETLRQTQKFWESLQKLSKGDTEKYVRLLQIAVSNLKIELEGTLEKQENA